jgi:hypothetical protein
MWADRTPLNTKFLRALCGAAWRFVRRLLYVLRGEHGRQLAENRQSDNLVASAPLAASEHPTQEMSS